MRKIIASLLLIGAISSWSAIPPGDILQEASARVNTYKGALYQKYAEANAAHDEVAWRILATINAIEKTQHRIIGTAMGYSCSMLTVNDIIKAIEEGRNEVRKYIVVSQAKEEIEGVLDAWLYARAEIMKNAR